jgi:hypothetical protein
MSGRPEDARSRHRAPDRGECENGVERQKEHGNAGEIVVRVYRSDRQGHPSNYNESRRYYCYPNHGWSLCRFASTLASRVLDQTLSVSTCARPGQLCVPLDVLTIRGSVDPRAWLSHAPGKIRTCDLCLRRAALYPLSYGRSGRNSVAAFTFGEAGAR